MSQRRIRCETLILLTRPGGSDYYGRIDDQTDKWLTDNGIDVEDIVNIEICHQEAQPDGLWVITVRIWYMGLRS